MALIEHHQDITYHNQVAGELIDLSTIPQLSDAYTKWDAHPDRLKRHLL